MAIWHRGEAVRCRTNDDGGLEFEVTVKNRHSPYLVYELGPADVAACQRFEGPGRAEFHARVIANDAPELPFVAKDTDYLILAPKAYLAALKPLIQHREDLGHRVLAVDVERIYQRQSGGNPDPAALKTAVERLHAYSGGKLRYLLLVGDVRKDYRPSIESVTPVPTFYRSKVIYPDFESDTEYPTDYPYSLVDGVSRIAVGRLAVQNTTELKQQVQKIVQYETHESSGTWQRRLLIYGGPTDFGTVIDSLIEKEANHLLNAMIPYDFDVEPVFANLNSPFAYRFDELSKKLVDDMNQGALLVAYVGHGLPNAFDEVEFRDEWYAIGQKDSMSQLKIKQGKPFFLSFACHTGAYDASDGTPSIAEELALNPMGPIAVFASSRASHPYPNSLYARRFVDHFLKKRPLTLGDGLLAVKEALLGSRNFIAEAFVQVELTTLREEHLGLYNLLGDPATRLRYPAGASVKLNNALAQPVAAGEIIRVEVDSPRVLKGQLRVTLETTRTTIPANLVSPSDLKRMSTRDVFLTMAENHRKAVNKVLYTKTLPFSNGRTFFTLAAPKLPGRYFVKVFVQGASSAATGHAELLVNSPTP
jgi:hypothetical protein